MNIEEMVPKLLEESFYKTIGVILSKSLHLQHNQLNEGSDFGKDSTPTCISKFLREKSRFDLQRQPRLTSPCRTTHAAAAPNYVHTI